MKPEFSEQFFEHYWNIKFHKNPFSGSRVVASWRTDRHNEANSRFSQYILRVSYFNNTYSQAVFLFSPGF